jgi:hypothetical protein
VRKIAVECDFIVKDGSIGISAWRVSLGEDVPTSSALHRRMDGGRVHEWLPTARRQQTMSLVLSSCFGVSLDLQATVILVAASAPEASGTSPDVLPCLNSDIYTLGHLDNLPSCPSCPHHGGQLAAIAGRRQQGVRPRVYFD